MGREVGRLSVPIYIAWPQLALAQGEPQCEPTVEQMIGRTRATIQDVKYVLAVCKLIFGSMRVAVFWPGSPIVMIVSKRP